MKRDGCFLLADVAVVVCAVCVGDRLAYDADFLALDRDLDGFSLLDDVLTQADLAGFDAVLGDVELLFGADQFAVGVGGAVCGSSALIIDDTTLTSTRSTSTSRTSTRSADTGTSSG